MEDYGKLFPNAAAADYMMNIEKLKVIKNFVRTAECYILFSENLVFFLGVVLTTFEN